MSSTFVVYVEDKPGVLKYQQRMRQAADKTAWLTLAARNLALAEEAGLDIFTICSGCTGTLSEANQLLKEDETLRAEVNRRLARIGRRYEGGTRVRHVVVLLREMVGIERVRASVTRPLTGVRVALHYGCHLLKPSRIMRVDDPDDPRWAHLLIEAATAAGFDRPDVLHEHADGNALIDSIDRRLDLIGLETASRRTAPGFDGDTTYLCTAGIDRDGRRIGVSLIQSNYMGFGSGVVVPGTGISLQNRGAGFSLAPGHPNEVAGGKRPYHTIIPGFVTRDGAPLAAFGVMGGPIQPPGHVQTLVRLVDYGMNPQAALDAPRWKLNAGPSVDLEASAPASLRDGLIARGHPLASVPDSYMDFGAGQFIVKTGDGYVAASDPRRDGQAAGF